MQRFWQVRRGGAGAGGSAARDTLGVWLAVVTFTGAWIFRFLSTTGFHNDHFMHLAWANQVLGGEWPIRDFVDPGMPLTYLVSAAAQIALGRGALAEAVLCVTLLALGAALTSGLARRASGSAIIGLLAAIFYVIIAPRLYSYPKIVLHLWAVWAFWRYADRRSRGNLAWIVACTVMAFLTRHDHGLFVGAAAVALLVAAHVSGGLLACARQVLAYAGASLLALSPFLIYVQVNAGLRVYFRAGIEFARSEQEDRRLGRWPALDLEPPAIGWPPVVVRWAPGVAEETRSRIEMQHGLRNRRQPRERAWTYDLADATPANVRALVNLPEVEDTAGINRSGSTAAGVGTTLLGRWGQGLARRGFNWLAGVFKRDNAVAWLYAVFVATPFVTLAAVGLRLVRTQRETPVASVALAAVAGSAVLCLVTNYGFLRDPLETRLADASALPLVLAAWLIGQMRAHIAMRTPAPAARLAPSWARAATAALAWTAITVVGATSLVSAAELGDLDRALAQTRLINGPRRVGERLMQTARDLSSQSPIAGWIVAGDEHAELKQLTAWVRECTAPADHLLLTWFEPEVYFYAGRRFAAGLAFFHPGFFASPEDQRLALSRLQAQSVPVALVEAGRYDQFFTRDYPQIAAYLEDRYQRAAEVAAADGHVYRVLTDRRATPVRAWESWSLPCFR